MADTQGVSRRDADLWRLIRDVRLRWTGFRRRPADAVASEVPSPISFEWFGAVSRRMSGDLIPGGSRAARLPPSFVRCFRT
jgi:hypothetical protein